MFYNRVSKYSVYEQQIGQLSLASSWIIYREIFKIHKNIDWSSVFGGKETF